MSESGRKYQHVAPRKQQVEPNQHRGLIFTGIALFVVVFWAVTIWGVAGALDRLAGVPVLLLSLADMIVGA